MRQSLLPIVALSALAGACMPAALTPAEAEPLPAESATLAPVALRVRGVVIDRWGYVIPNAWVTVRVGSPIRAGAAPDAACPGATHLPTRTRTSPLGEFDVVVEAGRRPPFRACLEVEALPPPGLPWRENTSVVPDAAFAPVGDDGEPANAVVVRVILY